MKKFSSVSLALILVCFLALPVYAEPASDGVLKQPANFSQWVGKGFQKIIGYSFGLTCPNTEDQRHYANEYLDWHEDRDGGIVYRCKCAACGANFNAYESDLQQSYQQQVSTLPASGIGSDGALYITVTGALGVWSSSFANSAYFYGCPHFLYGTGWTQETSNSPQYSRDFDCDNNTITLRLKSGYSFFGCKGFGYCWSFLAPIDGMYVQIASQQCTGNYILSDGVTVPFSVDYNTQYYNPIFYAEGDEISSRCTYVFSSTSLLFASCTFYPVIYRVVPYDSLIGAENPVYNINTRPTVIDGGNYGVVGDDNNITTITNNNKIINETNNTYYNPATGQTYTITDWTYNYDGRIYNITLDTGDTVSVEYGDENITIVENTVNEGDTIVNNYTIYYMIDGSGSGDNPDPSPDPGPTATTCPHAWAETSRTDPTCISPGSVSFSCSKCGETKTDKLPATGHTWQVLRTVQTAYDEEGNLVQQGYTIYQCAICSEQYKDTEGTGPPGGGDKDDDKETIWDKIASFFGSIVDGIAGIFEAILGKLLDALTALSELLMGKVKDVVEVVLSVLDEIPALFDGFLNFLALIFPFLPPEITLLLTFGVIAVVFIGIIKAIRR